MYSVQYLYMPAIPATATCNHHMLTLIVLRPYMTMVFLLATSWSQPETAIFTRTSENLTQPIPKADSDLVLLIC